MQHPVILFLNLKVRVFPVFFANKNKKYATGKGTYSFGYDIDDPSTENKQFKDEERKSDGTVTGKYGWVADDGLVYIVSYVADQFGYRRVYKLN